MQNLATSGLKSKSSAPRAILARSGNVEIATFRPVLAPEDKMKLGKTDITVPVIGVGAWAWGDRSGYW